MQTRRIIGVIASFMLLAAACGGSSSESGLAGYSDQMQEVESTFLVESMDHGPPTGEDYPLDDELVYFTHAFDILESRVEGWKGATPPDDLSAEHNLLVSTMEDVQKLVLDYAQQAALGGDDFEMDELAVDAEVVAASEVWRSACRDLAEKSILLDAPIAFAGSCAVPTLTES
jgi:hypothetical protein